MHNSTLPHNVLTVTSSVTHPSIIGTSNPFVKLGDKYRVTLIPDGGFKIKRPGIDDRRLVKAFAKHEGTKKMLNATGIPKGMYVVDPDQSNEDYLICLPLSSVLIF